MRDDTKEIAKQEIQQGREGLSDLAFSSTKSLEASFLEQRRLRRMQSHRGQNSVDTSDQIANNINNQVFDEFIHELRSKSVTPKGATRDRTTNPSEVLKRSEDFYYLRVTSTQLGAGLPYVLELVARQGSGILTSEYTASTDSLLKGTILEQDHHDRGELTLEQNISSELLELLVEEAFEKDLSQVTALELLRAVHAYYEKTGSREYSFEHLVKAVVVVLNWREKQLSEHDSSASQLSQLIDDLQILLPDELLNHLESFQASYLNREDLSHIGITNTDLQDQLLETVAEQQLAGSIATRYQALGFCAKASPQSNNKPHAVRQRLFLTGSEIEKFVIVQERKLNVDATGTYECRLFDCVSKQQFSVEDIAKEAAWEINDSGNYPALVRELQYCNLTERDIIERLVSTEVANLPELEEFCRSLQWKRGNLKHAAHTTLKTTKMISAANATFARIERKHAGSGIGRITIGVGYQGANHEGTGLRHILKERGEDSTLKRFRKTHETDVEALERFLKEAVLYCAGTGNLSIPSRYSPNSHVLLFSPILNSNKQFVSLVLGAVDPGNDQKQGEYYIVTSMFYKDKKTLRYSIKRELRELHRQSVGLKHGSEIQLNAILDKVNLFFTEVGIKPLEASDIAMESDESITIARAITTDQHEVSDEDSEFELAGLADDYDEDLELGASADDDETTYIESLADIRLDALDDDDDDIIDTTSVLLFEDDSDEEVSAVEFGAVPVSSADPNEASYVESMGFEFSPLAKIIASRS